jgi:hypothetical protein
LRGGLHAGRGRRHRTDDAVDAAFEITGEIFHRRVAIGRGPRLGCGFGLLQLAHPQRAVLEDLHGGSHRADLVAAADTGNIAIQRTVGKRPHAGAELTERA